MKRLQGCLGRAARILAPALAVLVVSPSPARAQVIEPGMGYGYPSFGYGRFGYPGYSYGAPRFGYPFFGFPGLFEYGSVNPGVFPNEVPSIFPNNAATNFVPNRVASPRILTGSGGQAKAGNQDEASPRVVSQGGGGSESGARDQSAPVIYRGPPAIENP